MDSFSKILNLIDLPTAVHKEIILLYNHNTNEESICNLECDLTDETKTTLKRYLTLKPYETSTIIQNIKSSFRIKHNLPFEDLIYVAIRNYIEVFAQGSQNEIDSKGIYSLISLLEFCDDQNSVLVDILPQIYDLVDNQRLNKDVIYLTLLPQNDILNEFIKYERKYFNKCNLNDSSSLFRYCVYKNNHWLFHIMENDIGSDLLSHNIASKLLLLKLNHFTNVEPINISNIENIILKLSKNDTSDKFLQNYIVEIKWNLYLYQFICKINSQCKTNFKICELKSCLEILSSYISLKNTKYYEELNDILIKHEIYLEELQKIRKTETNHKNVSELDLYNGFCILTMFEYYITENKNENFAEERVEEVLKKAKQQLLRSKNYEFQLEVFENVFSLLFIQAGQENIFLCGKKEIYYIATVLKTTLKEMKRIHFSAEKDVKRFSRLVTLQSYVNDTLWRLELLKSLNILENTKNLVNMMLSSPNTLIYLCLENDNFEKAYQIIQMYKMQNTEIAQQIEFIERMQYLKSEKNLQTAEILKLCNDSTLKDLKLEEIRTNYKNNPIIKSFNEKDETFINMIDVALTISNHKISKELFEEALKPIDQTNVDSCNYLTFCNNILQIFNNLIEEELSVQQILNSTVPLNLKDLQEKQLFYKNLNENYDEFKQFTPKGNAGFNLEHISHQSLEKLIESLKIPHNHLYRLYTYLKLFSELLFIKSDNSDILGEKESCIFDLMYINTAQITGKLLLRGLSPKELEPLFKKLKFDIIYHISWNCLPEIDLQIHANPEKNIINKETYEEFFAALKQQNSDENISENKLISPDKLLLSYIRRGNWLLAYLINKVYRIEEAKPDTNSDRTKYFNNLLNLTSIKTLQKLFNDNNVLTALQNKISVNNLLAFLEQTTNWSEILVILNNLPEKMLFENENIVKLKGLVVYNMVNNGKDIQDWKCVDWIVDNNLRIKCILGNLASWPGTFCVQILNCQLSYYDLNSEHKKELEEWFYQIQLYENIKTAFALKTWNEVYEKTKQNPEEVFLMLLTSKQVFLLLKWIEIQRPKSIDLLHLIKTEYFLLIMEENTDLNQIHILLDLIPFDQRIQICKDLIKIIKKLNYLEFITNYLINLLPELESEYKSLEISLKILTCFPVSEHEYMLCLINKPLLILEQLIMNVRLEKLNSVLEKITPVLKDSKEKNILVDVSFDSIDSLLRVYAQKSLDFQGIQPSTNFKNLELKLMQSLDTLSEDSERKNFVLPEKVPDKSAWVQNEQALECMCCREVIFSMFNRRHHCRRCGRVICGSCSYKRMEIPEYGSIPVRVCNDCFKNSQPEDQNFSLKSELSSNKSGSLVCWLLNDDEKHNDIVREEFSYEYAPSVSLCLSILKLHSNSVEYARFLLNQGRNLLPYLQDKASEIDFFFVIKMIISLATVAKIASLNYSFKAELSQCNELLLHIELLELLVEKDCLELLRSCNKGLSNDLHIDSKVLRRLRDKLIEQEQYSLALEICTKVGLEKTGIFAAWGKSFLKAGCLQLAREKFQYCLEKHYDTNLDLSINYDDDIKTKSQLKSLTLSTVSESRIVKTPPLIHEIINVLESNGKISDKSVFKTFEIVNMSASTLSLNTTYEVSYDPAVCILNKLKNLKNIKQDSERNIEKLPCTSSIEPVFYNECLYYLMRYGSQASILNFFIKHEEIEDALNFILEYRVPCDIFVEIYMKCLENGKIELLQKNLHKMDNTLTIWEIYLKAICRYLEKNSMFNVLYQLQVFMGDYVRAAMTCIKFYRDDADSYRELLGREEFLQNALSHLKQELDQEQWVQVSSSRKQSTASSGSSQSQSYQPSLIMKIDPRNIDKYINTIWRQIEITKFLAECETNDRPTLECLNEIFTFAEVEKTDDQNKTKIPTLFDTQLEKNKLAVLALVCGKNIEEGFGIAFRIIQDHSLKYLKIYSLASKYLAQILREDAVIELIKCIQQSGLNLETVNETCDEVLMVAISALVKANGTGIQLENLIKLIKDNSVKIDAYIESRQLKRAYLLAIRYNKISDIKKILREAERLNQPQIKAICLKRLQVNPI